MISRERLYLSTVANGASELARRFGIGLELAEFCTASNMDGDFAVTDARVREGMRGVSRFVFHMPFNELYPAAIDPKARALAMGRLVQATRLAGDYGIFKLVAHSGYVPLVYHKSWHAERSAEFWRELLASIPAEMMLCVENVMEDEPYMPVAVAKAVGDPRLRLCLDLGHANVCAKGIPAPVWVEEFAPYLAHVHLHNNDGGADRHAGL
ncbi:MAG TPA: TIM barrel protein, partial [Clostridia bacterium]|nr:TIM barrel protein [Clostridia bacterium]